MKPAVCSIFFHNYYGDHAYWVRFFAQKMTVPFNLFYNIVEDSVYNLSDETGLSGAAHLSEGDTLPPGAGRLAGSAEVSDQLRQAASGSLLGELVLRRSPNQGKDIGGKLVLLDAYMRMGAGSDFLIFLHDKKSPYKIQSQEWQQSLFRIIEPPFIEKAMRFFAGHAETGIIAGAQSIKDEYDYTTQSFASNNRSHLVRLQSGYSIMPAKYNYVAGTMFWARSLPVLTFLTRHAPLDIRKTLESGNVLDEQQGTVTHSWERLLSWLIIAQGFGIKGF